MNLQTYPDRASWLAGRGSGAHPIGGSDIPAIMGRAPKSWGRSPWSLWARARGLEVGGFTPAQQRDLDRGRRWELPILEDYAERTGASLTLRGTLATAIHPLHSWARCSPDEIAITADGQTGLVEVKTDRHGHREREAGDHRYRWGEDGTVIDSWDESTAALMPPHVALQVLWSLEVTGLPWCDIVVGMPQRGQIEPEVRALRLMAQPAIQADLLGYVAAWRERHMVGEERPEIDASADCTDSLRLLYGEAPEEKATVPADAEQRELVLALREARDRKNKAETEAEELSNRLIAAIGDGYGVSIDTGAKKPATCILVRKAGSERVSIGEVRKHPDILALLQARGLVEKGEGSISVMTYGL